MTKITIPAEDELGHRLEGVGTLLVARRWERAAIVYAYTDVGGPRNSRQPKPPRVNIRQFASRGYAGLTTPKAVTRYRHAWVTAIDLGWAVPVNPGDTVELPDRPFPEWMSAWQSDQITDAIRDDPATAALARRALQRHRITNNRRRTAGTKDEARLLVQDMDQAAFRLARAVSRMPRVDNLTPISHTILEYLEDIQRDAHRLLTEIRPAATVTTLRPVDR
jgi:hypothetical protein